MVTGVSVHQDRKYMLESRVTHILLDWEQWKQKELEQDVTVEGGHWQEARKWGCFISTVQESQTGTLACCNPTPQCCDTAPFDQSIVSMTGFTFMSLICMTSIYIGPTLFAWQRWHSWNFHAQCLLLTTQNCIPANLDCLLPYSLTDVLRSCVWITHHNLERTFPKLSYWPQT